MGHAILEPLALKLLFTILHNIRLILNTLLILTHMEQEPMQTDMQIMKQMDLIKLMDIYLQ